MGQTPAKKRAFVPREKGGNVIALTRKKHSPESSASTGKR